MNLSGCGAVEDRADGMATQHRLDDFRLVDRCEHPRGEGDDLHETAQGDQSVTIRPTPATFAGRIFISTDEG